MVWSVNAEVPHLIDLFLSLSNIQAREEFASCVMTRSRPPYQTGELGSLPIHFQPYWSRGCIVVDPFRFLPITKDLDLPAEHY